VFHDRAAASGNARSPRLDRLVAGKAHGTGSRIDVELVKLCYILKHIVAMKRRTYRQKLVPVLPLYVNVSVTGFSVGKNQLNN